MYRSQKEISEIDAFFAQYDWHWIERDERQWWPKFCFHYTDLHNIPAILNKDFLYCRRYLETHDSEFRDAASQQVLEKTNEDTKRSVRFYLRPRTPPQYRIEGIKSKAVLSQALYQAHCPMPVFLLFDIKDTLSRRESRFSDGNLGSSQSTIFSQPKDLWNLPWRQIYHNSSIDWAIQEAKKREIIRRRCAEIIIPEKIDLNGLKFIYCRSEAEKETLLHLLQKYPQLLHKYQKRITSSGKYDLFFRRHTFVEKVSLLDEEIHITFSLETESPGPFTVKLVVFDNKKKMPQTIEQIIEDVRLGINAHIPVFLQSKYTVQVVLDDYLAYENSLSPSTLTHAPG